MAKQVPFDVYIKIFPQKTGKRHEYTREIQRISSLIYDALTDAELYTDRSSAMNMAEPGGGQQLYNRKTGNKYSSLSLMSFMWRLVWKKYFLKNNIF